MEAKRSKSGVSSILNGSDNSKIWLENKKGHTFKSYNITKYQYSYLIPEADFVQTRELSVFEWR